MENKVDNKNVENKPVERKYTLEQIEKVFESSMSMNFAYLDKAVKELNTMDLKGADKFTDVEKQKFNFLHQAIAIGLDVTHRTYPLCYDIFPQNTANLDNAFAMFKRFEKANLLKECPCQYCKDTPEPEKNKVLEKDDAENKEAEVKETK